MNNNKKIAFFFCTLVVILACIPGSVSTKDVSVDITTFVDESGKGILPETYKPLPNTLVIARWNIHGNMFRKVQLTDQNGQADISVSYTHLFDVSVVPPCGYDSTTPLFRDMTSAEKAEFGFWPANPSDQLSRVKVLVWTDLNSNGTRDPQEEVLNEKISVTFNVPGEVAGNTFNGDDFAQESDNGWFDINLGNSCGTIYLLWLKGALATKSVSEPGKINDDEHGNVSIEVPYAPGETTIYWEIK
ncbi:MAG: hypothetical protein HZB50_11395 [Chloroflexi bacterium]|nr:hypothetical protein [Chloroflexota bacterium]